MVTAASNPSGVPSVRVQAGDVIAGKYQVERVLATGGMGVVVAAQHQQLLRRVALKFLLPELCDKPELVARFLREAQAMTTIQNEHVARVLDVGTTGEGTPFMVMEYLEGEDLGQTLERRGPLPVEEAVDYLLQAMEALAEAHVHGFVHRDLKPSNLFVTHRPDGAPLVKVLDFGISKAVAGDLPANLTQTNGLLGSPLYMSPEQIRSSKTVDTRADIWTLGVILHELIVGKPPFEGESVPAVLAAIVSDDPIPLKGAPPGLAEILRRCMRRNKEERYPTVAELAADLRPFAPDEGRVSVDRIARVVAAKRRATTPIDLEMRTPPKGTPVPKVAPLAQTAQAPPMSTPPYSGPPDSARDNSTFGKYRLLAILGHGGMADVFLAVLDGPEGLGFSKLVVLKRLRPGLAGDPEFVSMLVDEARIAAKLNHPNVIQTHEVGVIANEYYIAMEYLDGQPLNRILQRMPAKNVPLAFRLGIVRDLLAGLHHAHELVDFDGSSFGLVHRDVTPQNLFVTYDGQIKVVDFGIAKAKGRATETQQGIVKGKVGYMAPEQAGGQDVDRRADIFGAGVILWELLTGERMWKGLDDVAIMQKLLLDKIPSSPRSVNPDVPKALDAIVKRALSRKRESRFDTAQDFQLEIERFMESEGLKTSPREIGGWASELFEDRRKRTRSLVEAQLSAARSPHPLRVMDLLEAKGGTTPSGMASGAGLARLDQEPVSDENISRPDAVMARSHHGSAPPSSLSRSKTPFVIVGGALLVVSTAFIVLRLSHGTKTDGVVPVVTSASVVASPPSAPPVPSAPGSAEAIASAESPSHDATNGPTIAVSLVAQAPGAEFTIEGEPKVKSPVSATRPRDKHARKITVTAPGFRPEAKTFKFDADVSWAVQLVPLNVNPSTRPASPVSGATTAVAPTTPASATTVRKKRELDPDSPYAGDHN